MLTVTLADFINATPIAKHDRAIDSKGKRLKMTNDELSKLPKGLELERLMAECLKWNADPHQVIAQALSAQERENAETSGMTMKAQSDLAWKIVDKSNPSQQAISHSGGQEFTIIYSKDDEKL